MNFLRWGRGKVIFATQHSKIKTILQNIWFASAPPRKCMFRECMQTSPNVVLARDSRYEIRKTSHTHKRERLIFLAPADESLFLRTQNVLFYKVFCDVRLTHVQFGRNASHDSSFLKLRRTICAMPPPTTLFDFDRQGRGNRQTLRFTQCNMCLISMT